MITLKLTAMGKSKILSTVYRNLRVKGYKSLQLPVLYTRNGERISRSHQGRLGFVLSRRSNDMI